MSDRVDLTRVRSLRSGTPTAGPVVYWMSRDQRVHDNWALLYAQDLALKLRQPLIVAFCLLPNYLGATLRQYEFMLKGLEQVESECRRLAIEFQLLTGSPDSEMPKLAARERIGALVTDFTALRINRKWKDAIVPKIAAPFYEVDAHNIVPCWVASPKQEFAAYTFRPKIHKLLPHYLTEYPRIKKHPHLMAGESKPIDWAKARKALAVDRSVGAVADFAPGEAAAHKQLQAFLRRGLQRYHDERNLPTHDAQSNLSPYLHFGQIAAQRVALEAQRFDQNIAAQESFLEELIVRRELSDNFCHYNEHYDAFAGFHSWAQTTLNQHRGDERSYLYSREDFENARTHDGLWNAAQIEMVTTGKMHGYLRMYWAKKILEWTGSPEEALETAIYLNDRYELDGRDPNGYAGIAWSIGGVHDRAWGERAVFGKIRYMSYDGCARKFDVKQYIARFVPAEKKS